MEGWRKETTTYKSLVDKAKFKKKKKKDNKTSNMRVLEFVSNMQLDCLVF